MYEVIAEEHGCHLEDAPVNWDEYDWICDEYEANIWGEAEVPGRLCRLFERNPTTIKILNKLGLPDLAIKVSNLLNKKCECNTTTSSKNPLDMLKKHEIQQGNAASIESGKKLVADYVQLTIFLNMKFVHMTHLHYSENKEGMTKEEKNRAFGLISRLCLEKFCGNIENKEKWWNDVRGVVSHMINKKQNTVLEVVKRVFISTL